MSGRERPTAATGAPQPLHSGHQKPSTGKEAKQGDSVRHRKFAADPTQYANASIVTFDARHPVLGPPGSAHVVLTFRNVHNWVVADTAPAMFKAFFDLLKPGGTLGVVDHRAAPGAKLDAVMNSGCLPTASVIKFATDAGFKLQNSSEINVNAKDTRDHPKGLWMLPPTLALGDKDKAKPAWLWPRDPPVRFRQSIPTSWLELHLREGRNRQVRRMTAAAGFPMLRLMRQRIGEHALDGLLPGEMRLLGT